MTLYLKYRPQKLDDLDLESVRDTLKKIIKSGRIPHAFLFSGPKGSGKTSAARIIAKIVNCESSSKSLRGPNLIEPCNKCNQCLSITQGSNIDVIELDAASHRGIDDVRSLRDAIKLSPANAQKKVYIIDESHMLTTEASNALLKTLEEPPEHAIFILATTNPEKLLSTIRSRTTNIIFKRATDTEITRSLNRVVRSEKLKVDKGVLGLVAKASGGSFRDAVKILEELSSQSKSLKKKQVEELLFQKSSFDVDEFLTFLYKKDAKSSLLGVEVAIGKGVASNSILATIIQRLRDAYLEKLGMGDEALNNFEKSELISLIELFSKADVDISSTIIEQLPIEIAIAKWCEESASEEIIKEVNIKLESDKEVTSEAQKKIEKTPNPDKRVSAKIRNEISDELWSKILLGVRPQNTSTEALLRAAQPVNYDGDILELGVFYKFHKERLETNQHRSLLEAVASQVLGNGVRVVCTLIDPPRKDFSADKGNGKSKAVLDETQDDDIIKVAKDIFGS